MGANKKPKRDPIPDGVREEARSSWTCAFWCDRPMVGTARDVDGAVLPSCGLKGHGKPL
jgi:hypothetical protein